MTSNLEHPDGFKVFFRPWRLESPRAVVVLVHGLGEHSGRYEPVARFYNQASLAVIGFDFPGFGQSSGKRGHAPSLEPFYKTIDMAIRQAGADFPGVPIFLSGQSMGGNLVLNYALSHSPQLAGLMATSPWIRVKKMPPAPMIALARIMRRVYPAYTQSNGIDPGDFSRDPDVMKNFIHDPLTHDRISAAIGFSLLESGLYLDQYAGPFPCPLLLTHGTQDKLTDHLATQALAGRVTSPVTLRLWEGLFHETHFEPEKHQVLEYQANWIDQHINIKQAI